LDFLIGERIDAHVDPVNNAWKWPFHILVFLHVLFGAFVCFIWARVRKLV